MADATAQIRDTQLGLLLSLLSLATEYVGELERRIIYDLCFPCQRQLESDGDTGAAREFAESLSDERIRCCQLAELAMGFVGKSRKAGTGIQSKIPAAISNDPFSWETALNLLLDKTHEMIDFCSLHLSCQHLDGMGKPLSTIKVLKNAAEDLQSYYVNLKHFVADLRAIPPHVTNPDIPDQPSASGPKRANGEKKPHPSADEKVRIAGVVVELLKHPDCGPNWCEVERQMKEKGEKWTSRDFLRNLPRTQTIYKEEQKALRKRGTFKTVGFFDQRTERIEAVHMPDDE